MDLLHPLTKGLLTVECGLGWQDDIAREAGKKSASIRVMRGLDTAPS